MKYIYSLITFCTLFAFTSARNILDYNVTLGTGISVDDEFKNARALERAFEDANNDAWEYREVLIPKGAVLSMMPTYLKNLTNVSLRVEGQILQSMNWVQYPFSNDDDSHYDALLWFEHCDGILIEGKGTIDGQGFMWWVREILQKNKHTRPYIIRYHLCRNLEIKDVLIQNSPYYHIVPYDCENIYMHDFEIYVDIWGQLDLHRLFSYKYGVEKTELPNGMSVEMPIFPLNTDGIDIWAKNATFRRVKITNFDDSIVPKPCNQGYQICKCTTDILIEDCETLFTVGMTIGSVPPSTNHACIKDVIFRNVYMNYPIKGIYVKPNPGDRGDGLIQNITYENFKMDTPIWWAIWIGPQQQHQPGGTTQGCSMFYPFGKCDTYKAVTMDHITLKNITSTNSLLPAGVILCNDTNPCTNFHFEDVNLRTPLWDTLGYGWIYQYVEGQTINVFPDLKFKPTGYYASLKEEDKIDETAEIQKLFTAESMMSHLVSSLLSIKKGEMLSNENTLKGLGINSEILNVIQ